MFLDNVLPWLIAHKQDKMAENLQRTYLYKTDFIQLLQDGFQNIVSLLLPAYFKNQSSESLTEIESMYLEALELYRNQITPEVCKLMSKNLKSNYQRLIKYSKFVFYCKPIFYAYQSR